LGGHRVVAGALYRPSPREVPLAVHVSKKKPGGSATREKDRPQLRVISASLGSLLSDHKPMRKPVTGRAPTPSLLMQAPSNSYYNLLGLLYRTHGDAASLKPAGLQQSLVLVVLERNLLGEHAVTGHEFAFRHEAPPDAELAAVRQFPDVARHSMENSVVLARAAANHVEAALGLVLSSLSLAQVLDEELQPFGLGLGLAGWVEGLRHNVPPKTFACYATEKKNSGYDKHGQRHHSISHPSGPG